MFEPKSEILKLVELLSKQILMGILRRMEKTGDKICFLGRLIKRTARDFSVEANPKYIRNKEDDSECEEDVKKTSTTESLVELESERRAM